MARQSLGFIAIGFAAGFAVATLAYLNNPDLLAKGTADNPTSGKMLNPAQSIADRSPLSAPNQRHVHELSAQPAGAAELETPAKSVTDQRYQLLDQLRQVSLDAYRNEEIRRLKAAGFDQQRIEWIKKRTEELHAEWLRAEDEMALRQKSPRDMAAFISHNYDSDIGLRHELGDDEYSRYRQALGRGVGLRVSGVTKGGIGERAGLRPGDEILTYNGVRVFNPGELMPLVQQHLHSGTTISLDVLRNGQRIRLTAESGDLRIDSGPPIPSISDLARRAAPTP